MGDSILDGYDKADVNKILLLIFVPEYIYKYFSHFISIQAYINCKKGQKLINGS